MKQASVSKKSATQTSKKAVSKKKAGAAKAATRKVAVLPKASKISKTPITTKQSREPLVSADLKDKQYLFGRFSQLYQHSAHARFSFACLALLKRGQVSGVATQSQATLANEDEDPEIGRNHWLHKPYPYSGAGRILVVVAGVACLSVVMQVMYPSGRTLPLSHLEGNGFTGLQTKSAIEQKIGAINSRAVTVTTRNSTVDTSYANMGVRANADDTFKQLSHYPLERRLIPFSIFFSSVEPTKVSRDINVEKLTSFTKNIVTVTSKEPKSASVSMQNNRLLVIPSEDGYRYEQTSLQKQIAQTSLSPGPISLEPQALPAKLSTQMAQSSIIDMQKRIDSGLTISAADQNLRINSDTIASWVVIDQKPEIGTVKLYFDKIKVQTSLQPVIAAVDNPGVPTQVTLLNGVEAGRKNGSPGRSLQFDDLVNQVSSATDWTVGLIQANVTNLPTKEVFARTYSRDSLGFQSLLDYWVKNNKGRFGVEVRNLGGKIDAGVNSNQQFSGTHKLYLPHLAYGRITSRALNPGYTTSTGFTIDGCVDKVVLSGHDACTRALGDLVGWGDNNSLLAAQGFESTTLSNGSGVTSADDGADWAIKLLGANITTVAQRSALISLMNEQNTRSGIPAGVPGVSVANRTGQSGSVRYDVGVVYNPRGTYVLSVFTDGSSFATIADLAREVNTVMNQ